MPDNTPATHALTGRCTSRLLGLAALASLIVATAIGAAELDVNPVQVERGEIASVSGCNNGYTRYRPAHAAPDLAVMIVPGFMRDRSRMRGWAEALAERGLTAVTMDFCQPTAFDGRHAENARDMIAVREALGLPSIVYAGHSAGGLASLLAAADDPAVRAIVLFDPVDFADLAEPAAARVSVPALVLLGRPGICNLRGNIRPALPHLARATVVEVDAATHCDFEWPGSALCRIACDLGGPGREQRSAAEQRIRALALDFVDSVRAAAGAAPPSRDDAAPAVPPLPRERTMP
jgi:pimeloyl-ACP methyl ester carboxylesterase